MQALSRDQVKEVVLDVFRYHFKNNGIDETTDIRNDLDATSIDEIEFIVGVEEEIGKDIDLNSSIKYKTVGEFIDMVMTNLAKG